jgi:hypothetical protein
MDIRFLFDKVEEAVKYHYERMDANSEGQPPVPDAPIVGEDCFVFGGTNSVKLGDMTLTLTFYCYIFRVGRVVVKLFVAEGPTAHDHLTIGQIASLAERIVQRIRMVGLNNE